jgi:hypothetical protein
MTEKFPDIDVEVAENGLEESPFAGIGVPDMRDKKKRART